MNDTVWDVINDALYDRAEPSPHPATRVLAALGIAGSVSVSDLQRALEAAAVVREFIAASDAADDWVNEYGSFPPDPLANRLASAWIALREVGCG